jgi:hypothetical protein
MKDNGGCYATEIFLVKLCFEFAITYIGICDMYV